MKKLQFPCPFLRKSEYNYFFDHLFSINKCRLTIYTMVMVWNLVLLKQSTSFCPSRRNYPTPIFLTLALLESTQHIFCPYWHKLMDHEKTTTSLCPSGLAYSPPISNFSLGKHTTYKIYSSVEGKGSKLSIGFFLVLRLWGPH